MNNSLNNFELSREKDEVPLSVLFTDGHNFETNTYKSKEEKLHSFIDLCNKTNGKELSASNIIESVVKNALLIEFGEKILSNREMLSTISQSINSELVLKEEVISFAMKHFQEIRIDSALIN